MRNASIALGLLTVLSTPVRAEEPTFAEKSWVRTCVSGLTAASPRQRASAAAALARMGPSAVATIVPAVSVLKTDEQWDALKTAFLGMGAVEVRKELEKREADWPRALVARRKAILEDLAAAASKPGAPGVAGERPKSPDDVAAKVREILESFEGESSYGSDEPRVSRLIALGHSAVPAILDDLKRERNGPPGFRSQAAADALARLLLVDDMPEVAAMLDDGHLAVARALTRIPAEVAVPALLKPLTKGLNSFDLVEGLRPFQRDERIQAALIRWLEAGPDTGGSSLVCSTALLLAQAGARAAVPALRNLIARTASGSIDMNRRGVAEALVTLGEKQGIEVLLDIFRAPADGPRSYDRHAAGEKLNEVVGRGVYRGNYGPGGATTGNFDEAAQAFDRWWSEVKDEIRYDDHRQAWVTH
jgi:hypothetical protein